MEINYYKNPLPYIIVKDMYTSEELEGINAELDYYIKVNNFLDPWDSSSARDEKGRLLKNNLCIDLDTHYENRNNSIILKTNRKLWDNDAIKNTADLHWALRVLLTATADYTLLSYYEKSHFYKSHTDRSHVTAVTWFMKDRSKFTGGDITFPRYKHTVKIQNNMTIIFPSSVNHSVSEVNVDKEYIGKGYGRWAMSQFITHKDAL